MIKIVHSRFLPLLGEKSCSVLNTSRSRGHSLVTCICHARRLQVFGARGEFSPENRQQFAANETKNAAKTKMSKAAFGFQLFASRSIRCEENAGEMRRSAGTKRIKNDPVK